MGRIEVYGRRGASWSVALAAAVLVLVCSQLPLRVRALGGPNVCSDVGVEVTAPLSPPWNERVLRMCEELAEMRDVDPSARLRIAPAGPDLLVEALLEDGRRAQRSVHLTESLMLTVEALVVVPQRRAERPSARTPETDVQPAPKAPNPPQNQIGVEVGLELVGRIATAPTYLSTGFSLHAGLRPADWFFYLSMRWEPGQVITRNKPSDFEMDSLAGGIVIGRRLLVDPIGVDLGLNLLMVGTIQSYRRDSIEHSFTGADGRLSLLGRVLLGHSSWRWSGSLDAAVSPLRLRHAARLDPFLPTLPVWSFGIGLGGTWEGQ